MKKSLAFIIAVLILYAVFSIVFDTLPRNTYSQLEKRDLTPFPEYSATSLADGSFTEGVSKWFSDTEPFRDFFSSVSMEVKGLEKLVVSKDGQVSYHEGPVMAAGDENAFGIAVEEEPEPDTNDRRTVAEYTNSVTAEQDAKIGNHGIIITGTGENVRAMMTFRGNETSGTSFANVANRFNETFGDSVRIYCMAIPTSVEFYCPDKARDKTKPERPVLNYMFSQLNENVKAVDIYTPLSQHVQEDIYLRTDHHWAPLGAYYAAQELCRVAGVPFKDLSHYEKHVVHNYVGSMFAYTKDISVKKAPEDFAFYTPVGVNYTTTYIKYYLDAEFHITGEARPSEGEYFDQRFTSDGNGNAYCVFMGGDSKITQVRTDAGNGRRILILKDSFGNAVPGWLFFSFEEVHVIDFRYFNKNLVKYVKDNAITDIVLTNNLTHAISGTAGSAYLRFLSQH